jgi:hypothetical protein
MQAISRIVHALQNCCVDRSNSYIKFRIISCATMAFLMLALNESANAAVMLHKYVRQIHGYRFVIKEYDHDEDSRTLLELWKGRVKVLEKRSYGIYFPSPYKQDYDDVDREPPKQLEAADLTGGGAPNIIIQYWYGGGPYCCYKYEIYSLGPSLKRIWYHDAVRGHLLGVNTPKHQLPELVSNRRYNICGLELVE